MKNKWVNEMEVNLTSIETTLRDIMLTKVGQALKSMSEIEKECGQFDVKEKVSFYEVTYENEHERPADLIWYAIKNASTDSNTASTLMFGFMLNWERLRTGHTFNGNTEYYGVQGFTYMVVTTSASVQGQSTSWFIQPWSTTENPTKYNMNYYSKADKAILTTYTGKYYFQVGTSYEWGAYWLPEVESEGE